MNHDPSPTRLDKLELENFRCFSRLEVKCREKGKLRIEGKEYVMKDGDVVEWRFNV